MIGNPVARDYPGSILMWIYRLVKECVCLELQDVKMQTRANQLAFNFGSVNLSSSPIQKIFLWLEVEETHLKRFPRPLGV